MSKQKSQDTAPRAALLRGVALCAMAVSLSACFGSKSKVATAHINNETKFSKAEYGVAASPRLTTKKAIKRGGGYVSLGKPYKIKGKWYTPKDEPGYDETGVASWYGPNFHGRLTANGEIYDQYTLSAAHPTLPLPSYARVTNLANGHSTIVRINDRGPYAHGRLIDLSSRTADVLDFKREGTAKVRVEFIGRAPLHGQDVAYLENSIRAPGYRPGSTPAPQMVQEPSVMVAAAPTNADNSKAKELFGGNPTPPSGINNGASLAAINSSQPVGPTGAVKPVQPQKAEAGSFFKGLWNSSTSQEATVKQPAARPSTLASDEPMQLPGVNITSSNNGSLLNSYAAQIDQAHKADDQAQIAIKKLLFKK